MTIAQLIVEIDYPSPLPPFCRLLKLHAVKSYLVFVNLFLTLHKKEKKKKKVRIYEMKPMSKYLHEQKAMNFVEP